MVNLTGKLNIHFLNLDDIFIILKVILVVLDKVSLSHLFILKIFLFQGLVRLAILVYEVYQLTGVFGVFEGPPFERYIVL